MVKFCKYFRHFLINKFLGVSYFVKKKFGFSYIHYYYILFGLIIALLYYGKNIVYWIGLTLLYYIYAKIFYKSQNFFIISYIIRKTNFIFIFFLRWIFSISLLVIITSWHRRFFIFYSILRMMSFAFDLQHSFNSNESNVS